MQWLLFQLHRSYEWDLNDDIAIFNPFSLLQFFLFPKKTHIVLLFIDSSENGRKLKRITFHLLEGFKIRRVHRVGSHIKIQLFQFASVD